MKIYNKIIFYFVSILLFFIIFSVEKVSAYNMIADIDDCPGCTVGKTVGVCDSWSSARQGLDKTIYAFRVSMYDGNKKIGQTVNYTNDSTSQDWLNNSSYYSFGNSDRIEYINGAIPQKSKSKINMQFFSIPSWDSNPDYETWFLNSSNNYERIQRIINDTGNSNLIKWDDKEKKFVYKSEELECDDKKNTNIYIVIEPATAVVYGCISDSLGQTVGYSYYFGTAHELNYYFNTSVNTTGLTSNNFGYSMSSAVNRIILNAIHVNEAHNDLGITGGWVCYAERHQYHNHNASDGYGVGVININDTIKLECEPNCCIPCNTNDDGLRKYIAAGGVCDSNNCEGETEIAIGVDDKGLLVCEPNIPDIPDIPDVPGEPDVPDCDNPDWKKKYPEKWKELCQQCEIPELDSEVVLGVCTSDNSKTKSYFRDPVFNSDGGTLKDYNTIEDLIGLIDGNGNIKKELLEKIAKSSLEKNSFQAVAAANNSVYSSKINNYCSMHCQEIFEVELPINNPIVEAGRYFRWHIKDEEDTIAKAEAAKLCVVDIDLDRIMDEYLKAIENARLAARNQSQFELCPGGDKDSGHCTAVTVGAGEKGEGSGVILKPNGATYNDCGKVREAYSNCSDGHGMYNNAPCGDEIFYASKSIGQTQIWCDNADGTRSIGYDVFYRADLTSEQAMGKIFDGHEVVRATPGTKFNGQFNWTTCEGIPTASDISYKIGNQPSERMLEDTNVYKSDQPQSAAGVCEKVVLNYSTYILNYTNVVESLINSLEECNKAGDILIDMGVELNYQTLFGTHTYSSEDGDIYSETSGDGTVSYDGRACIDGTASCSNDSSKYTTSYFSMDGSERKLNNDNTCETGSWEISGDITNQHNNDGYGLGFDMPQATYSGNEKAFSYFNNISIGGGYSFNRNFDDRYSEPNFKQPSQIQGNVYKLVDDNGKSLWNTIYASIVSADAIYKLDDAINACICKDGYVEDLVNGECSCVRMVSYKDYSNLDSKDNVSYIESNNYQRLDFGSLTVEYMNGSGLYPIDLKYWKLGSISDGVGHFDSIVEDSQPDSCENGVCSYSDPSGVCRYVVVNRIIFDDTGDCGDEPCPPPDDTGECDDGPCLPSDIGECITNGVPNEECRRLAGLGVIYRIIDLNDPFPDRTPASYGNWSGKETVITENRGVNGTELYSDSSIKPLYSFELTPSIIKNIRRTFSYGKINLKTKYTNGSVIYPNGSTTGGYSPFVHEFLGQYGTINIDDDQRFTNILNTRDTISLMDKG